MPDLTGLYQEMILDHSKRPHNFRRMEAASAHADGYNPLCGDKVALFLKLDQDRIVDASFQGSGCAISTASASILTDTIKGKTRAEVQQLFDRFHNLVTGKQAPSALPLGKLAVFAGVSEFPARVKCATLAWHTMKSALDGSEDVVSTEGNDGEDAAAR